MYGEVQSRGLDVSFHHSTFAQWYVMVPVVPPHRPLSDRLTPERITETVLGVANPVIMTDMSKN